MIIIRRRAHVIVMNLGNMWDLLRLQTHRCLLTKSSHLIQMTLITAPLISKKHCLRLKCQQMRCTTYDNCGRTISDSIVSITRMPICFAGPNISLHEELMKLVHASWNIWEIFLIHTEMSLLGVITVRARIKQNILLPCFWDSSIRENSTQLIKNFRNPFTHISQMIGISVLLKNWVSKDWMDVISRARKDPSFKVVRLQRKDIFLCVIWHPFWLSAHLMQPVTCDLNLGVGSDTVRRNHMLFSFATPIVMLSHGKRSLIVSAEIKRICGILSWNKNYRKTGRSTPRRRRIWSVCTDIYRPLLLCFTDVCSRTRQPTKQRLAARRLLAPRRRLPPRQRLAPRRRLTARRPTWRARAYTRPATRTTARPTTRTTTRPATMTRPTTTRHFLRRMTSRATNTKIWTFHLTKTNFCSNLLFSPVFE